MERTVYGNLCLASDGPDAPAVRAYFARIGKTEATSGELQIPFIPSFFHCLDCDGTAALGAELPGMLTDTMGSVERSAGVSLSCTTLAQIDLDLWLRLVDGIRSILMQSSVETQRDAVIAAVRATVEAHDNVQKRWYGCMNLETSEVPGGVLQTQLVDLRDG